MGYKIGNYWVQTTNPVIWKRLSPIEGCAPWRNDQLQPPEITRCTEWRKIEKHNLSDKNLDNLSLNFYTTSTFYLVRQLGMVQLYVQYRILTVQTVLVQYRLTVQSFCTRQGYVQKLFSWLGSLVWYKTGYKIRTKNFENRSFKTSKIEKNNKKLLIFELKISII